VPAGTVAVQLVEFEHENCVTQFAPTLMSVT
jgi:hypothetical protein